MRRVLVISDTHHGHLAGLTPPEFWLGAEQHTHALQKFAKWQRESWQWFENELASLGPIDTLFHVGDWIEGKGERSGSTELVFADRLQQVEMGEAVFEAIKPKHARFVYGTPAHVGREEDWEAVLAAKLGVSISAHCWPEVDGVVFDLKHKVGSSSVPYARSTAITRSRVWNLLEHERELQPRSDVLLRGHVHYYWYNGDGMGLNMTLPALQGWGSKFGARECEGHVDFGFLVFDCEDGEYTFKAHLMDQRPYAPKVEVL